MVDYRVGCSGNEVKQIQQRLAELRLYSGALDGSFGGGTESAVKAFQRSNDLSVDGIVGGGTWTCLFNGGDIPRPALFDEPLDYRCLALTGTFETNVCAPDCFCALSGDFDGQGISFGVLQWNFGQNTLQPMLKEFVSQNPDAAKAVFQDELDVLITALNAPHDELMTFVRSIQHAVKHTVNEPWRGMAKALGRTPAFQQLEVKYAGNLFNRALDMSKEYGLKSQRAAMLMFDICVQNGSISQLVKSRIVAEFNRLSCGLSDEDAEVKKMQIIANRRADAADPRWAEDVRARKLTIANGAGVVHGVSIDLAGQFGITLAPF